MLLSANAFSLDIHGILFFGEELKQFNPYSAELTHCKMTKV